MDGCGCRYKHGFTPYQERENTETGVASHLFSKEEAQKHGEEKPRTDPEDEDVVHQEETSCHATNL